MVAVVVSCLSSFDNNILTQSLKILRSLSCWDLIKKRKKEIISSLFNILEKLTSSDIEMARETFKCVKVLFILGKEEMHIKPNK